MERATPVRKTHTSTADLLTWTEAPPPNSPTTASSHRLHQPSDRISKLVFGGQVTDEEAESLTKKKPSSDYKLKEVTGSRIFGSNGQDDASQSGIANPNNNKTCVRICQQTINGISQISFNSEEESVSPKKPTSIPEVAKQRELSGSLLQNASDMKTQKQISDAKFKEISGHDIFAPPLEIAPRLPALSASCFLESKDRRDIGEEPAAAACNIRTSVKVSNPAGGQSNILFQEKPVVKTAKKIHNQKFQELTGNDIFRGDAPPGSPEKPLSRAKLREMSGSDIFADGKAESRDYLGGVRKPPGGESSIALV